MLWVFVILLIIVFLIAHRAYAAKNYLEPNAPFYSGNYAPGVPDPMESLTVISYNIGFALNIDRAIEEIQQIRSHKGLDILLLQEMDEVGVQRVAMELKLNYVYYPAAIESTYRKNFGNAVLSLWPIVASQKLILPHISFSNRMKRVATRGTIQICDEVILAYSIHTEPVFTLPQFKVDQYLAVLSSFRAETCRVIVGGDFNTFTTMAISKMDNSYGRVGLERASRDIGYTFVRWGLRLSPDHIFSRGFVIREKDKLVEATASDHLPIWVKMV